MSDTNNAEEAQPQTDGRKKFRSEIEFPYSDLESAVELAKTIHDRMGNSCEFDELAAWMGQTAGGGTFRTRVSAAKMFGLIEKNQNRAALTQLGRNIISDPDVARDARVTAFLNVELFGRMYDQYKGNSLPPPPGIERHMEQLGVSPKQKERARQTFIKSANYAGFIDSSTGRFVKPGIACRDGATKNPPKGKNGNDGPGSDGKPPTDVDPIIEGLLARLPKAGQVWPEAQRDLWLELLKGSFKLIYKDSE